MILKTIAIDIENRNKIEIETSYVTLTPSEGWLSNYSLRLPKEYIPAGGDVGHLVKGDVLDKEVYMALAPYLRKGSTIVDVGAHMGTISMILGRELGALGGGKVVAIEASPQNYACTEHNLLTNLPKNVIAEVTNAVCGRDNEREYFPVHDATPEVDPQTGLPAGGAKITGQYSYGIHKNKNRKLFYPVKKITIDDLHLQDVSVIKIDAEGSDLEVLAGAIQTIARCRPAIVFEDRNHENQMRYKMMANMEEPVRNIEPFNSFVDNWRIRQVRPDSGDDWLIWWPSGPESL